MRTKICGITNLDDALLAVQYGAWAIGFNFYSGSPRYISPNQAKKIILKLPKDIIKIGIFINTSIQNILNIMSLINLDYAQIYQPNLNTIEHNAKYILSLNINSLPELPPENILKSYHAILLDSPKTLDSNLGGTGRLANWDLAKNLAQKYKLILAGGLTPKNIQQALKYVNPYAVDIASGVEYSPGIKNPKLLKQFLTGECDDPK